MQVSTLQWRSANGISSTNEEHPISQTPRFQPLSVFTALPGDSPCHGPHCGIQFFVSVSGSRHPCLTVVFCYLFVQVNPRRGASGFCGLKLWTWSSYHHQRVAVNGHICSQVVDIVVMDLVQKTAMCAVLRSQGVEVQSILMDHILCRRRFAVPAAVEVISIPIWNSFAFQSAPLVARRCLQIRCSPLAETARRESDRITFSCIRCRPQRLCSGTSVIIPS